MNCDIKESELSLSQKASETLFLFNSMMKTCSDYRVDMTEAVNNVGFILYAMNGGQAKRNISTKDAIQSEPLWKKKAREDLPWGDEE